MSVDDSVHDPANDDTLSLGDSSSETDSETDNRKNIGVQVTLPSGAADEPTTSPSSSQDGYDIIRELARGGMGRVLQAHDRRLKRKVALKEMLHRDARSGRRFQREAMITARLQHPAIVPVYEAGTRPDGTPYYAMKLVEGTPLDKLIARAREPGERMALLPKMLAVTEALAYAHSRGVIHRDLKPANIIVGEFGETVVIDWGLAKQVSTAGTDDEKSARSEGPPSGSRSSLLRARGKSRTKEPSVLTAAGAVMGTPVYMPPEQAHGYPADRRSDVYALGAILYHLLSGQLPRTAATLEQLLEHVRSVRPEPLAQIAPSLPVDLSAIVDKAMAENPDERYPSAEELAEELRRFQTGQFVSAHDYSTGELVGRWLRRHRAAVAVAAVLSAVLLVVGTVAVLRVVDERDAAERARDEARISRVAAESLVDYMLVDLNERLAPSAQLDLLEGIVGEVQTYFEQVGERADDDAALERQRRLLLLVGDVFLPQGEVDKATSAYTRALEISRRLAERHPDDQRRALMVATAQRAFGQARERDSDERAALVAYTESTVALRALAARQPDNAVIHEALGDSLMSLGDLYDATGDMGAAFASYREVGERASAWAERQPGEQTWLRLQSTSQARLSASAEHRDDAIRSLQSLIATGRAAEIADPDDNEILFGLGWTYLKLGNALQERGDREAALSSFELSSENLKLLSKRDPKRARARYFQAVALRNAAALIVEAHEAGHSLTGETNDLTGAEQRLARSSAVLQPIASAENAPLDWQSVAARVYLDRAALAARRRDGRDEARALLARSRSIIARLDAAGWSREDVTWLGEKVRALADELP